MVLVFCMSLVLLGIAPMVMAQGAPSGDPAFVPSGAQLELLVKGDDLGIVFTEGAAVGCDGKVYFSDITFSGAPNRKRHAWDIGRCHLGLRSRSEANAGISFPERYVQRDQI